LIAAALYQQVAHVIADKVSLDVITIHHAIF
jgi:hypothetical protein